jgi:hypothetical protein
MASIQTTSSFPGGSANEWEVMGDQYRWAFDIETTRNLSLSNGKEAFVKRILGRLLTGDEWENPLSFVDIKHTYPSDFLKSGKSDARGHFVAKNPKTNP